MQKNHLVPKLKFYEEKARLLGYQTIAGVDEAGRGPLAGPVVAAACILPDGLDLQGINDSKQLSEKQREAFFRKIQDHPDILTGIGIVEAVLIDQLNILKATLMAMATAVGALKKKPDFVLIDGNRMPTLEMPCEAIVQGDTLSQSIMAAAIVAKVTRDQMMVEYNQLWPEYGFADHKGYPTKFHREALKRLGPTPIHRKTFKPVRNL